MERVIRHKNGHGYFIPYFKTIEPANAVSIVSYAYKVLQAVTIASSPFVSIAMTGACSANLMF